MEVEKKIINYQKVMEEKKNYILTRKVYKRRKLNRENWISDFMISEKR